MSRIKLFIGSKIDILENLIIEMKKNFLSFIDQSREVNIKRKRENKVIVKVDKWRVYKFCVFK